jgi:hypothetical protein
MKQRPLALSGSVAVMVIGIWAASVGTAGAAGPCDVIVQASNQVTQEQLAFTIQAYSDGQITPEEAAQAEVYSQRIAQITADLASCISTGVVPPGYGPLEPPPPGPPVTNTFKVGIARWHIGDHDLKIFWDTSVPTKVQIRFKPVGAPEEKAASVGSLRAQEKAASVGSLRAPLGVTSLRFDGKVGGHRLKPGRYLLELIATDAAGNKSKPKTKHLTILPKRKR